jgi:hypothetical protein
MAKGAVHSDLLNLLIKDFPSGVTSGKITVLYDLSHPLRRLGEIQ